MYAGYNCGQELRLPNQWGLGSSRMKLRRSQKSGNPDREPARFAQSANRICYVLLREIAFANARRNTSGAFQLIAISFIE